MGNCISNFHYSEELIVPEQDNSCSLQPNPVEVDMSHFIMKEVLGSGGFGVVQRAIKITSPFKNTQFAVKKLSKAHVLSRKNGVMAIFRLKHIHIYYT